MGPIEAPPLAGCDAGPLLHVDELDRLDLVADMPLGIPEVVWQEIHPHRPAVGQRLTGPYERRVVEEALTPPLAVLARTLVLDAGEGTALALITRVPQAWVLTDDAAARLAAQQLGYQVHGSMGIMVRAIRRHQRTASQVVTLVQALPHRSSLSIRPALLQEIIARVEHEYRADLSAEGDTP
jgi:predicted nucleic acid-binding protein